MIMTSPELQAWKSTGVLVPFLISIIAMLLFWSGFTTLQQCDKPEYEQSEKFKEIDVDCESLPFSVYFYLAIGIFNIILCQLTYMKIVKKKKKELEK